MKIVTVFTCVGPNGPGYQIVVNGEVGFNASCMETVYEKIEKHYGVPYKELVYKGLVYQLCRQVCEVVEP